MGHEIMSDPLKYNSNNYGLTYRLEHRYGNLRPVCEGAFQALKHSITQLMHNITYVDKIKIIKYLKVLQHVSDHRRSIIRETCTVLG